MFRPELRPVGACSGCVQLSPGSWALSPLPTWPLLCVGADPTPRHGFGFCCLFKDGPFYLGWGWGGGLEGARVGGIGAAPHRGGP